MPFPAISIPPELVCKIFQYLLFPDLHSVACTCKYWRNVCLTSRQLSQSCNRVDFLSLPLASSLDTISLSYIIQQAYPRAAALQSKWNQPVVHANRCRELTGLYSLPNWIHPRHSWVVPSILPGGRFFWLWDGVKLGLYEINKDTWPGVKFDWINDPHSEMVWNFDWAAFRNGRLVVVMLVKNVVLDYPSYIALASVGHEKEYPTLSRIRRIPIPYPLNITRCVFHLHPQPIIACYGQGLVLYDLETGIVANYGCDPSWKIEDCTFHPDPDIRVILLYVSRNDGDLSMLEYIHVPDFHHIYKDISSEPLPPPPHRSDEDIQITHINLPFHPIPIVELLTGQDSIPIVRTVQGGGISYEILDSSEEKRTTLWTIHLPDDIFKQRKYDLESNSVVLEDELQTVILSSTCGRMTCASIISEDPDNKGNSSLLVRYSTVLGDGVMEGKKICLPFKLNCEDDLPEKYCVLDDRTGLMIVSCGIRVFLAQF